jgi:hypothetical protein
MVDPIPVFNGRGLRLEKAPAPLVDHMPNPSRLQAFRYGVHRALKAVLPDRTEKEPERGKLHWGILKGVWRRYQAAGDIRRAYALMGVDSVLEEGRFERRAFLQDYAGQYTAKAYAELEASLGMQAGKALSPAWKNEPLNDARWREAWYAPSWL